nr:retrovirus-related Pol polyprotein from transposon TNT 1-94 [Tanacetum cinerariifolium]
ETIESLKSKSFESSEKVSSESKNQRENDCLVVEKKCDKEENPKVIAPGMFKFNVSQCVSPISMSKSSCDFNNVEIKLKRKRHLDTFSSVRRPKNSDVIWKKKWSSNTLNVGIKLMIVVVYAPQELVRDAWNDAPGNKKNAIRNFMYKLKYTKEKIRGWLSTYRLNSRGALAKLKEDLKMFDEAIDKGNSPVEMVHKCLETLNKIQQVNNTHMSEVDQKAKGLEVAFRKSTCFFRNEDNVDLLTGDRSSNLYTIALNEVASNSSTCLLAKASSSQSWLWHQRLSHLNFATINNLVKNNLVQGLPKMKFEKDHLCSACEQGKIHQKHHKSKTDFASNKPLYLLHVDFCGPMRVQSINGKRYVLVVVDDYSRYTWVFFLHSKDEAFKVIISFIKKSQVNLQLQGQRVRTDNGTEFKNKTLAKFFDEVGITQQFSVARTPQQNGVVERRNQTLVKAARTMLTFKNLPLFLWVEAIATACFTHNHSIIHKRFDKNPYELINKRKPNIKFFRMFGSRCYLLNDYEDVGKLKAKGEIGVFVGYSKESVAFIIYNKRTRKIHESVNVNFDEISEMASKQFSLEPEEVILPQTNTQSIPINMIPNGDEASTSHNVFNERLEDAYFDASTSFHDPSIVQTFYQPYPHEKKWTKDHPLNKIIALRDADWVSALQEELDQYLRLKVWRLVPRPEGKSVIKTKWIFKNKKDESSLVIRNKARLVAVG